jgi:hypothetical protein
VRRRRIGVADYRFGARLHSEIAQPLRVPFACSRKTNDGSRNRLARWVDHAPVMQGLDGEFECDAQETRRLWIEPLPVKIFSDRHIVENSSASLDTIWFGRELLSVGYPTKNPNCSRIFARGIFGKTSRRQPRMTPRRDWVSGYWSALEGVFRLPKYTCYVHTLWAFIPDKSRTASQRWDLRNDSHDGLASGTAELPDGPAE